MSQRLLRLVLILFAAALPVMPQSPAQAMPEPRQAVAERQVPSPSPSPSPAPSPSSGAGSSTSADPTVGTKPATVSRDGQTVQTRVLDVETAPDGRLARAGSLVVQFKSGTSDGGRGSAHQDAGGQEVRKLGSDDRVQVSVPRGQMKNAIAEYEKRADVIRAEPDYIATADYTPNDPQFPSMWGMTKIQAPAAWDITRSSSSTKVAVLDCGVYGSYSTYISPDGQPGHPDVRSKVVQSINFTSSPNGADDYCNHGTHVAGTVAAVTNNGIGVVGVGHDASIMNVKVLGDDGSGSSSWIISGMVWAADNGARVINMSLGAGGGCPSSVQDGVNYAWSRGVVVVAAAGNDGAGAAGWPANCANVISVAATDSNDNKASFSNYGPTVQVAAPGVGIISSNYAGGYSSFNGTSMATPHVSGLAALVWSTSYGSSASSVANRIRSTADPIAGTGSYWAYGRINAYRAVNGGSCGPVQFTQISPASPQVAGSNVTATASATSAGGATCEYRFWRMDPGSTWTMVRDWSTTATFTYAPLSVAPGAYKLSVWTRVQGQDPATWDASNTAQADYTLSPPPCNTPQFSQINPASPQQVGTNVSVTASATATGGATCEYRFFKQDTAGTWTLVRDWSTTATYTYSPLGTTAGAYRLGVWTRKVGVDAPGGYSTNTANTLMADYVLNPAPVISCTNPQFTQVSPASPQQAGTTVAVTASATANNGATCEFRFWKQDPSGTWTMVRDWSTTATYSYSPLGNATGTYRLGVWTRHQGVDAPQGYSTNTNNTLMVDYTLTAAPVASCSNPQFSQVSPASPQAAGTNVSVTASATASNGATCEFRFWRQDPSGAWTMVRDWSTTATYTYSPVGTTAGTYRLGVWTRAQGVDAPQGYSTTSGTTVMADYTLTAASCSNPQLSQVTPASPRTAGTNVSVTATATPSGGVACEFRFWKQDPSGAWTMVRDWSTNASYTYSPLGNTAGTYRLGVWVRAQGVDAPQGYSTTTNNTLMQDYTLTAASCTNPQFSQISPASPRTAGTNVAVTASATPSGGVTCEYRFWRMDPSGAWTMVRDWSTNASYTYSPLSNTPGTYKLGVWTRAQGVDAPQGYSPTSGTTLMVDYTLTAATCTNPQFSQITPGSPRQVGTNVAVIATATPSNGVTCEYRFWKMDPSGNWTMVRDWGTSASYSYNPLGNTPGTYRLGVWVRAQGIDPPQGYSTNTGNTIMVDYTLTP